MRDFRGANVDGGHPDFQTYSGTSITTGLVEDALGADKKPVFKSTMGSGRNGVELPDRHDARVVNCGAILEVERRATGPGPNARTKRIVS